MLSISDLSVWYNKGTNILDRVSFTIESNKATGLLGVNGAGKTTLINYLSSVHKHYEGTIQYEGKNIRVNDTVFKLSRYTVFTEEQAFGYWSFEDYVNFIHKTYKRSVDWAVINSLTQGFGFEQYKSYKIKDLSTGNKKKVFLITGFALRLPLLILDEPLDGLDFSSSEYLYKAINEYKEFGGILMSSHIAESFEKTCDAILLLQKGKITAKSFSGGMNIRSELAGWLHEND